MLSLPGPADQPAAEVVAVERLDQPGGEHAFLAPAPVAPIPATEPSGRPPVATTRLLRLAPFAVALRLGPARVAALTVSRLGFVHELDSARLGYFSFGSTAPPPIRG